MKKTKASIYDFPIFYDLVFGSDTAAEMRFLDACFERYVDGKVRRVFEPACGTGRLLYRMGRKNLEVGGIDLSEKAVEFCNSRLERMKLKGRAQVGDMSDFEVKRPYDAAFNTINSFRHLTTEESALGHLESLSRAIRAGGIYVIGLHLTPTRGEASDEESWSARRGHLSINTQMWPVYKNTRQRLERFGIRFDVYTPLESMRIEDVLELRSYNLKQFRDFIRAAPAWQAVGFHDFRYSITNSIEPDATTQDVVVILKRQ